MLLPGDRKREALAPGLGGEGEFHDPVAQEVSNSVS